VGPLVAEVPLYLYLVPWWVGRLVIHDVPERPASG
jgi:hypothetical protein